MILGEKKLKELYPGLDDDQYQPAGIDLKLGEIKKFEIKSDDVFGIVDNRKVLPPQTGLDENAVKIVNDSKLKTGYLLEPHEAYIAVVDKPIKINKNHLQLYYPRSSLLRAGVDVRTAVGDPGFNGHLSFLIINHSDASFFIKEKERFAQMVVYEVDGVENEYDGDYSE